MITSVVAAWIAIIGAGMASMFIVERNVRR